MADRNDHPTKYTLFLNLEYVSINGVRTNCHALLLESGPSIFGDATRYQIRGFGMDPAWPVFDIDVKTLEHTLVDAQSNHIMITDSRPEGRPLCSGAIMQIKDGPALQLIVQDMDKPLDIKTFEGTWGDHVTMDKVWKYFSSHVTRYWTAPNMPYLQWGPAPSARRFGR